MPYTARNFACACEQDNNLRAQGSAEAREFLVAARALQAPHLQIPLAQAVDFTCNLLGLDAAEMFLHVHLRQRMLEEVMAATPVPHLNLPRRKDSIYCSKRGTLPEIMDISPSISTGAMTMRKMEIGEIMVLEDKGVNHEKDQ